MSVWDVSAMPFWRCRFGDAVSAIDVSAMTAFRRRDVLAMGRFGDGTFWRWDVLATGHFRWNILNEPFSSFHFWDLRSFIIPKILDLL